MVQPQFHQSIHRTLFYRVYVLGEVIKDLFLLTDVVMDVAAQELEVLVLEGDGFGVDHSFVV